jgi:hypothetical protein
MAYWDDRGTTRIDEETIVTHWECSACGRETETERGIPAPCACEQKRLADDLGYSLDHLRILAGPVCERCWNSDGEIIPAPHREDHHGWAPEEDMCTACYEREPGDQGEDDGGLTMAQQADVDARDGWMSR